MTQDFGEGLVGEQLEDEYFLITTAADPAAGSEITITIPGRARWLVHSIAFALVNDATPVQRAPHIVIDDGTTVAYRASSNDDANAAGTTQICASTAFAAGTSEMTTNNFLGIPLPAVPLMGGWRIRTITANLQVADNYGAPFMLVAEAPARGEWRELAYELAKLNRRLEMSPELAGQGEF